MLSSPRAYRNESVFIILFESSKTSREIRPHVDLEITWAAPELP